MRVDLPVPEGPESTTHSPAAMVRSTSRSTGMRALFCRWSVKDFERPSVRSMIMPGAPS